jgi:hypothetical protein
MPPILTVPLNAMVTWKRLPVRVHPLPQPEDGPGLHEPRRAEGARGTSWWSTDQWSTYDTKIVVPTAREAHYVLDNFPGNATDLPMAEHATDSHGATLINFALFDLVGKALTPRRRDLTRAPWFGTTPRPRSPKRHPHAGPLLGVRWNEDLVADCWPDLLRMAGSLKVRPGHRLADRRQMAGRLPAEHPDRRLEGMGNATQNRPPGQIPVRPGLQKEDLAATEQGREPARAAPRPVGHHHAPAP